MEERYGIPYQRISFFGLRDMASALRCAARFFQDGEMLAKAEEIIERETARVMPRIVHYRSRIKGKKAAIYMGARARPSLWSGPSRNWEWRW